MNLEVVRRWNSCPYVLQGYEAVVSGFNTKTDAASFDRQRWEAIQSVDASPVSAKDRMDIVLAPRRPNALASASLAERPRLGWGASAALRCRFSWKYVDRPKN